MILPKPGPAVPRTLCTDCGVSRSSDPGACGRACQFIAPGYPGLETRVHGRARGGGDELFFGPHLAMYRAALTPPAERAQWTGFTTALGAELLHAGRVDAILTMVPDAADRWRRRRRGASPGWA